MDHPHLLVVDDEVKTLTLLDKVLSEAGYKIVTAATGAEALEQVTSQLFDAVLTDIRMPEMTGLDLLREIKQRAPAIDVIMITGYPDVSSAVEALREGASDYLHKPFDLDELRHRLSMVMERRRLRGEVGGLRTRLGERLQVKELIGVSPQMARVKEMIRAVSASDSPVMVEGESGTGKELVAAAIHRLSARKGGPFIPVNCGAIPAELMESEFFGHVRGAFTGAVTDTLGLFRAGHHGSLFLDEVTELPLELQAKLLRVFEEKEVRPVGSTKMHPVDVRIIAATNRSLEQAVKEGGFRQDLFFRLNVVQIQIPPLRERESDIPPLVNHILRQLNERFGRNVRQVTREGMTALVAYDFPGNVRELENILERAYVLGASREITAADFPALRSGTEAASPAMHLPTLAQAERELILEALRLYQNDKTLAARALGLSQRTMYRRLKEYGLH